MFASYVQPAKIESEQMIQVQKAQIVKKAGRYFSSQPAANLLSSTIRAFPYVSESDSSPWYDCFAQRISFLETAFMASASALLNLGLAAGSTLLAVLGLGQVEGFNEAFKRSWLHLALALHVVFLGTLGFLAPTLAVRVALFTLNQIVQSFQRQISALSNDEGAKLAYQLLTRLGDFAHTHLELVNIDAAFGVLIKQVRLNLTIKG